LVCLFKLSRFFHISSTMRMIALALAFTAFGGRLDLQARPHAEHHKLKNAANAAPSSQSLAELEQLQSRMPDGVPNALRGLALLLLAGIKPADSFALHESRVFTGHSQLALPPSKTPSTLQRWSPVMQAPAVLSRPTFKLELERAPPAPPPPPPGPGGSGGPGGDDGDAIILKQLSDVEAIEILYDWIARTRIYCMSNQFGNTSNTSVADWRRNSLEELDNLLAFCDSDTAYAGPRERKLLVALYDNASDQKKVMALSGGGVSRQQWWHGPTFVVDTVTVNPSQINQEGLTAAKRLKIGLRVYAQSFGADLKLPDDPEWP